MDNQGRFVEIPDEALKSELLDSICKEYALREGTDYGDKEYSLEVKIDQLRRQIGRGAVKILFDNCEERCTLVTDSEFRRMKDAGLILE